VSVVRAKRFYVAALGVGAAFANMSVAVPLQVTALGGAPALTGALLAAGTLAIAVGAVAAGSVSPRIGGGPRTLALALAVCAAGCAVLAATRSIAGVAVAVALVGVGIGIFWVSSQLVLGGRSGAPGSESAFVVHFAAYTLGAVAGSSLTGATVAVAERAGVATLAAVQLSALVGLSATSIALLLWHPCIVRSAPGRLPASTLTAPGRHLAVQLPDLFLVGALGLLLPLAPLVLARSYGLGPLAIGFVMGGVSLAKIAGTFTAGTLTRSGGHRRSIVILLAGGASFCLLLCLALGTSLFVTVLLATTLLVAGAWPIVVDSAQARVPPEGRLGLTVVWNAREFGVIAAGTVLAGWLFGAFDTPVPLFALAAALIGGAAICSAIVLRRPVWRPVEPVPSA
jgi:MFS family permease